MNFSTAEKVSSVIDTMKNVEVTRAPNRALLNSFFNGEPPWTQKEASENNILINYNDKQGASLLHSARNQYENAFSKAGGFFKITVPDAPKDEQEDIGFKITRRINTTMRRSPAYYYTQDCVWGGTVLHGVGAKVWFDQFKWRPSFVGIQDILMPTDTDLTMENCRYLALRRGMKPGELFKRTFAKDKKNIDPGWTLPAVKKILDEYKDLNTNPQNYDWANHPEQMTELYKQNGSYYDSDAAPMISFWDFYYLEEETKQQSKMGWYRKLILDKDVASGKTASNPVNFIYSSRQPFCPKMGNFIHFQFGDGNNVPPFKYHSIRSLAWLVYDLVWIMNRLNCQFTQHVFEQLMMLFRVNDPADRDRLTKLVLQGIVGLLPEGLQMVTANERYQVNAPLVQGLISNLKQRVGETASTYTQQIDNGTQKERTKYEVQAVLAQVSSLMSSMLGRAYRQEYFADVEIARRFGIKNTDDFEVKKCRRDLLNDGVAEKWLDPERWEIEVEQVLGSGNRMLELAEATELMERKAEFDPSAQQEIKHDYVLAVTNNPKKAARLAPLNAKSKVTDSVDHAQQSFGSLMYGADMNPKEGLSHIEEVETLLRMMGEVIQRINATGGVGKPEDVIGLQNVAKFIGKHIQIIAQDPKEKPRVKAYTDALSKMMNEVRAFSQRQQEAAQKAGQQQDPEVLAKIQGEMALLKVKLQGKDAAAKQQLMHKEQKFVQQQRHKEDDAQQGMAIKTGQAVADTFLNGVQRGATPKSPMEES